MTLIFFFFFFFSCLGEEMNDKAALVSFRAGIVSDPDRALGNWNATGDGHVCTWSGVRCARNSRRVVELDLSGRSLVGRISASLSNLSSLEILDLSRNFLAGEIPAGLGRLSRLSQLSLSSNLLRGTLPAQLGSLRSLVYLDLGGNSLSGALPAPLFSSLSLQYVDLSNNSLSGEIPAGELTELRFLLLWSNRLHGRVPSSLAKSTKLEWLDLESNSFSGELPSQIFAEMPQLQFLYLSYNRFVSHDGNTNLEPFFAALSEASNFQELELAGNRLGGKIPSGIGALSRTKLVQLHLDDNLLYGPIPPEISSLANLTLMNLSSNFLNGTIPPELSRMPRLERVYLSNNSLSGEIPAALGRSPHLGLLDLSRNSLSGHIPESLSNLSQLRRLVLYENRLSGDIPRSLGECVNLEILDLARNELTGSIPARLGSLKLYLNLSGNGLSGEIPMELSKMDMVLSLDLSSNALSGTIPPQLGSCVALETLDLSGNLLTGPLPDSLFRLPYLRRIDVSSNALSGPLPRSLQHSPSLRSANLSFNRFSGPASPALEHGRNSPSSTPYLVAVIPAVATAAAFALCLLSRSRARRQLAAAGEGEGEGGSGRAHHPRISYEELADATGGFGAASLIGSGRFGRVYGGVLRDSTRVAVKVIDPGIVTAGSFGRECRILRGTRHRNLVRIITTCSRPDFKALVLPLMPNGSLERHLYPAPNMGLPQLVRVCSDVADALAYLHHHSPLRVVHCDLKPTNILLDDHMTAFVADFGISRLLNAAADADADADVSFNSTHGLLCGSLGYIAPEYGMGRRASTEGDVYSFGVLLLEIITGKRPTDGFPDGSPSLHEWVKSHYPGRLHPMLERFSLSPALGNVVVERFSLSPALGNVGLGNVGLGNVAVEMVEMGLMCTQYSPSARPTMQDVAHEMARLKDYVSNPPAFSVQDLHPKDLVL